MGIARRVRLRQRGEAQARPVLRAADKAAAAGAAQHRQRQPAVRQQRQRVGQRHVRFRAHHFRRAAVLRIEQKLAAVAVDVETQQRAVRRLAHELAARLTCGDAQAEIQKLYAALFNQRDFLFVIDQGSQHGYLLSRLIVIGKDLSSLNSASHTAAPSPGLHISCGMR